MLLNVGKECDFPGMLGSLDCIHWKWKNCPTTWAGRSGHPTIILEVVSDYDLGICHAHFGLPSSNNDINALEASHLFSNLASESCRKDEEFAFGVIQSRFAIVAGPSRFWNKHMLHDIMIVCIIMHNMIIKDERDINAPSNEWMEALVSNIEVVDGNTKFEEFLN
ncbi:uncharacterized protein LOC133804217 [Humulus lupulus]|uniref:uncharacterized protein LOC133804217 n=1 Tax=Humulus lupulus TaxID=3486 RepID=UPI002B404EA2|nr:uncharacterized protein LOC133804217 [Humulus lupulus]